VIKPTVTDPSTRHPKDQPTAALRVSVRARPIPYLGSFIDDLVESGIDIISKLDLRHRTHAFHCGSNSKPSYALLTQRRVENSVLTKFCGQVHRTTEYTTKGYVFAEQ